VHRSWECSTRWNEVGWVLLGETLLGGFIRWNEVGKVLLGGTKLVTSIFLHSTFVIAAAELFM
jgi:hypothetical protein